VPSRTRATGLAEVPESPSSSVQRARQQLAERLRDIRRDGGEFVHAMEWGESGKPAELGAYLAGVLLRKGARDLIMGIPH
jgi:hydroxymethylbilane synthase